MSSEMMPWVRHIMEAYSSIEPMGAPQKLIKNGSLAEVRVWRLWEGGRREAANRIVKRRGGIELPEWLRAEIMQIALESSIVNVKRLK